MISYLDYVLDNYPLFGQLIGILFVLLCFAMVWVAGTPRRVIDEKCRRAMEKYGRQSDVDSPKDMEINISVTVTEAEVSKGDDSVG